MGLFMETTKIPAERTAGEIVSVLILAGAAEVSQKFEKQKLVGVRWTMNIEGVERLFELPARIEPVEKMLLKKISVRNREKMAAAVRQQAERVAWRQLLRWVQAQVALIDTGMVESGEVFSPYMQVRPGLSMYKALCTSGLKMLPAGKES